MGKVIISYLKNLKFIHINQVKSYMMIKLFPLLLLFVMVTSCGKEKQINDGNEKLNMLLVANVSDADAFKKLSIDVNYPKFKKIGVMLQNSFIQRLMILQ